MFLTVYVVHRKQLSSLRSFTFTFVCSLNRYRFIRCVAHRLRCLPLGYVPTFWVLDRSRSSFAFLVHVPHSRSFAFVSFSRLICCYIPFDLFVRFVPRSFVPRFSPLYVHVGGHVVVPHLLRSPRVCLGLLHWFRAPAPLHCTLRFTSHTFTFVYTVRSFPHVTPLWGVPTLVHVESAFLLHVPDFICSRFVRLPFVPHHVYVPTFTVCHSALRLPLWSFHVGSCRFSLLYDFDFCTRTHGQFSFRYVLRWSYLGYFFVTAFTCVSHVPCRLISRSPEFHVLPTFWV